ncbi:MAG: Na/Pi cotransporter family protein [Clostridia bacterium]|nr:Na/Pi cotransporter family protein [Clostridia bacterium]
MDLFDILNLLCGLALFLFGMNLMGEALEKAAGSRMKNILASMTSTPIKGFLLGMVVTAVIQSSSATTVMVVGFVNSGIMTLRQAIGVIMGANVGTTITAWIISLTQVDGSSLIIQLFKPDSFVPVLAAIGIVLYMFQKSAKRKDIGLVLLGFAVLMTGMDTMSAAVSGLKDVPQFAQLFVMFKNPILGVLVGAAVTAIIQSSSASVGILQALSTTGSITCSACVPIIMGQNIGTCVTAMISSVGTSKNARRTAIVHLCFNVVSTVILLTIYTIIDALFVLPIENMQANAVTISITHTCFNVLAVLVMLPCARLLEKLACAIVRDKEDDKTKKDELEILDERLMQTPSVAIERCRVVTVTMAEEAISSVKDAMSMVTGTYSESQDEAIRESEKIVDAYEDKIGSYLVKLSTLSMTEEDSTEANKLLHLIGDFERISDHALNIVGSVSEINEKKLSFSGEAKRELETLVSAVSEILDITLDAFKTGDLSKAVTVEPLEQVVDYIKENLRKQHIKRLRKNECTIEMGFIQSDLLTDLERISDHCSNIAACMLEMAHEDMDMHEYLNYVRGGKVEEFNRYYEYYMLKYSIKGAK